MVCLSEQFSRAAETRRCLLNENNIYIIYKGVLLSTYYRPATCPNTLSNLILVNFEIGTIIPHFTGQSVKAQRNGLSSMAQAQPQNGRDRV